MSTTKALTERIRNFEFHPEVYIYPTPRMYRPLDNFSPAHAEFTEELNVYVHIPFCRSLCTYCGYFKIVDHQELRSAYIDAVVKEIALYEETLKDKRIKTLHFGGGTPSLLSSRDLDKIMKVLVHANPLILDTSQEVSIEATPESVELAKFKEYTQLGINRVSLGIQSFNGSEIVLSKRSNMPDISRRAIEIIRETGVQNLVIDLMIGIEGQSVESFQDSVKGALQVHPETVQFYALGLMPHTGLGKRIPQALMTDEQIYRCYEIGQALLLEAGYQQDCHDRYIIPGKGSFLQGGYVVHGMSLMGFGGGARSYAKNMHYRNTYDSRQGRRAIADYMKNIGEGRHAVESGIFLCDDEIMRQYAIGHIESLDKAAFYHRFGITFEERFSRVYKELTESGLVQEVDSMLTLTFRGLLFRDLIVKEFFSDEALKLEEAYRPRKRS